METENYKAERVDYPQVPAKRTHLGFFHVNIREMYSQ